MGQRGNADITSSLGYNEFYQMLTNLWVIGGGENRKIIAISVHQKFKRIKEPMAMV